MAQGAGDPIGAADMTEGPATGEGGTEQLQPACESWDIAAMAATASNVRLEFEFNIVMTSPFGKTFRRRPVNSGWFCCSIPADAKTYPIEDTGLEANHGILAESSSDLDASSDIAVRSADNDPEAVIVRCRTREDSFHVRR